MLLSHEDYMARALALAEQGLYSTMPNPRVGCVLVDKIGQVVGEGFHVQAGGPHAEVHALQQAGAKAQGATAYVTLEPCNHQGRTGPCSQALIDAGVASVVYALQDPNPLVAGAGLARLRAAGITVLGPVLPEQALALNPGFIRRMTTGLPWVRCKLAMSLDGRTAMANGESQWITGADARRDVQALRARSCAVVTGVNTLLQDNPSLCVREAAFNPIQRQPLRVVVDSQLRSPPSARLFQDHGPIMVATTAATAGHALAPWAYTLPATASGQVDLNALLRHLGSMGLNEVLVEAGPTLAGAFLQQGLIDELVVYMAPCIMGSSAKPLVQLPLVAMSQRLGFSFQRVEPIGQDIKLTAVPSPLPVF